jgi:DNA replication and repair protein RecF
LWNYRNHEETDLELAEGLNLVCGRNAQGKTNLLEAVSLVSTGRILRGTRDVQAIRQGALEGIVQGETYDTGTTIRVTLRPNVKKRIEVNSLGLTRASDVMGRIPTVSFSSEDMSIVTGEPSDRRDFMDRELAQVSPAYLKDLATYKRALLQRNSLLKLAQTQVVAKESFEVWEEQLALSGVNIQERRKSWIEAINKCAKEFHAKLGSDEVLDLQYDTKEPGSDLVLRLAGDRGQDIIRGTTSVGPHRDELVIRVEGQEARHYGSQGQQRTAVIALKLAVMDTVTDDLGVRPVLLLDDVFSDLDETRRSRLMEMTLEGGQVLLTCTEPIQAGRELVAQAQIFWVESGKVSRA